MTMTKGTRSNTAVGYVRVSSDSQVETGLSIEHQTARIQAYAAANGLALVEIITDEGISAGRALSTRPGGATLLNLIAKGRAGHVIALKLDRLFRNTADALTQASAWDKAGVGLHLIDVHGATVNTKSAIGRMFFTMMAGFAELERGLVAERTTAAMKVKRQRGEVISRPTLGYDRDGGKLVKNAAETALIGRIKAMRVNGQSFHRIADTLNAEQVPTKRGGTWHATTIRGILAREEA
jgi:DNA invertase Pin-like site-specific DNA recombinase